MVNSIGCLVVNWFVCIGEGRVVYDNTFFLAGSEKSLSNFNKEKQCYDLSVFRVGWLSEFRIAKKSFCYIACVRILYSLKRLAISDTVNAADSLAVRAVSYLFHSQFIANSVQCKGENSCNP